VSADAAMTARFDLAWAEQAPRAAARLVSDLLTEWGVYGPETRAKVRVATTALVAEVLLADPAELLTLHVELAGAGLKVAVTAPPAAAQPVPEKNCFSMDLSDDAPGQISSFAVTTHAEGATVAAGLQGSGPAKPGSRTAQQRTQPGAEPAAKPRGRAAPSGLPGPPTAAAATVTVDEIASLLGQGAWFVQRRLDNGELPAPDARDAAGGPLWRPETIRAWREAEQA
jgi:hypothetical protein